MDEVKLTVVRAIIIVIIISHRVFLFPCIGTTGSP